MGIDYKKKYLKYKNKYLEAKKIYGGSKDDSQQTKINDFVKNINLDKLPDELQVQPPTEFVENFLMKLRSDNPGIVNDENSVYGLSSASLVTLKDQLALKIEAAKQVRPPVLQSNLNKLQNLLDKIDADTPKKSQVGVDKEEEDPGAGGDDDEDGGVVAAAAPSSSPFTNNTSLERRHSSLGITPKEKKSDEQKLKRTASLPIKTDLIDIDAKMKSLQEAEDGDRDQGASQEELRESPADKKDEEKVEQYKLVLLNELERKLETIDAVGGIREDINMLIKLVKKCSCTEELDDVSTYIEKILGEGEGQ